MIHRFDFSINPQPLPGLVRPLYLNVAPSCILTNFRMWIRWIFSTNNRVVGNIRTQLSERIICRWGCIACERSHIAHLLVDQKCWKIAGPELTVDVDIDYMTRRRSKQIWPSSYPFKSSENFVVMWGWHGNIIIAKLGVSKMVMINPIQTIIMFQIPIIN